MLSCSRAHALLLIAFVVLASACGPTTAEVRDYQPVRCDGPLPYEGAPLYAQRVELPAADFVIGTEYDRTTTGRLDQALAKAMTRTQAGVMTAALATAHGRWSATRSADGSPSKQPLWWASAGKALTATIVLQLVEEENCASTIPSRAGSLIFPTPQRSPSIICSTTRPGFSAPTKI